jgi:hypothetical protein
MTTGARVPAVRAAANNGSSAKRPPIGLSTPNRRVLIPDVLRRSAGGDSTACRCAPRGWSATRYLAALNAAGRGPRLRRRATRIASHWHRLASRIDCATATRSLDTPSPG